MNAPNTPQKRRWLPGIIIILLVIGGIALMFANQEDVPVAPVTEKSWPVRSIQAEPQAHTPTLRLYGQITAPRSSTLTAALSADVNDVRVLEGQAVKKGELLVQLDDREANLALQQAQANLTIEKARQAEDHRALKSEQELLKLTERNLGRIQSLIDRKLGSDAQLDNARQNVTIQQFSVNNRKLAIAQHDARMQQITAQLERAKLDVDRTLIFAPYDGYITRVVIARGDRTVPGQGILQLFDSSLLEIRAQIPNGHINNLRSALAAEQNPVARVQIGTQTLTAQLNRLAAISNAETAGLDGFFRLDKPVVLADGQRVTLLLDLPTVDNSIPVPFEAIYNLNRIYQITDNRLYGLEVETLGEVQLDDGSTQILIRSPRLESGAQILTTQLPNAIDGLLVQTVQ